MGRKILSAGLSVLASGFVLASVCCGKDESKGFLVSGRADAPPVLDGVLDDACWKNCVEISPFVLRGENRFASEQTSARVCHDDKNLYVAFRCAESCLVPETNRVHEFKREARAADASSIWNDDCVMLLFAPDAENKKEFYDIVVNGAGIVNDAVCRAPDYWGSRDASWNSGAKVAARVDNGFWTVEMAVPFDSMRTTPKAGSKGGVVLGRMEKSRSEVSSWQPTGIGFHASSSFGVMSFSDKKVPGVASKGFPEFRPGRNTIMFDLFPAAPNQVLRVTHQLKYADAKPGVSWADAPMKDKGPFASGFDITATGKFKYRLTFSDTSSMEKFFVSPEYDLSVVCSSLAGALGRKTDPVFLNGQPFSGSGPLTRGRNVVAIKAEAGLSGGFSSGDLSIPVDASWKFSETEEQGWQSPGFDDSKWVAAPVENGALKKRGLLRKTVLFQDSMIWPNWEKEGVSVPAGGVQILLFNPKGVEGLTTSDYSLIVELPEGFEVIGASSIYGKHKTRLLPAESVARPSGKYKKHVVVFEEPMRHDAKVPLYNHLVFVLKAPQARGESEMFFHARAEKGGVVEVPQKLKLSVLPPLNGKQPKKLVVQMWMGWTRSVADKNLLASVAADLAKMGVNDAYTGFEAPGMRQFALVNFAGWNVDCSGYLKEHPEHARIDFAGNKSIKGPKSQESFICTDALLCEKSAGDFLDAAIAKFMEKWGFLGHVDWDYEHDVFSSYISCFCPRCLEKFKKEFSISADITPALIKEKHSAQWTVFMNKRMADVAVLLRQSVKKAAPKTVFSVYSGYQSDFTKSGYGVDWKLLAGRIDLAMCGYGRPEKDLADTQAALGSTPLVTGEIAHPYEVKSREYPSFFTKATLLRRFCDGTGGILLYEHTSLDGKSFLALSETTRLVADNEDFFVSGRRGSDKAKVSGISRECYEVLEKDGKILLLVMNPTASEKSFSAELAVGDKATEYYSKKSVAGRKIEAKIPAGESLAYLVE